MYAWTREHAAEERKPTDTEQQFLYKGRKKAIGPFKKQLWASSRQCAMPSARRSTALRVPDGELNIGGTRAVAAAT